ncbi:MAG: helicase-associated domain-containing protein [Ardenticatenia bacterium]|nr:helicase-associated domain-containing protein [Ardenticatenia bacterium]
MAIRTLLESLEHHPAPVLRAIAASHGLDVAGVVRNDLPRVLADYLLQPHVLARTLTHLSGQERALLNRLIAHGGLFPAHRVRREYGEVRELGPGGLERERPWEAPISPAERLWYRGLIYSGFGHVGRFRGRVFYIPADLLPLLPPAEEPDDALRLEFVAPPTRVRSAGPDGPVEVAFVVLSEVQRHSPRVDEMQGVLRRVGERLRALEPATGAVERRYLEFVFHMVCRLKLIVSQEGRLRLALADVRRWLQAPRDRRLLSLQRVWASDPLWNDLHHVPGLILEPTGWQNNPLATRERVLHWLRQVPPSRWVSLDAFVAAIKQVDPDFQRPNGDYDSWFIRDARTGAFLRGWASWDAVEGALLRHLITGPLHWLSVVDLGSEADSASPTTFRITPWGAYFLGHDVERPPPPARACIHVAPDGTVTVPPGADDWDRLHLERLSVPLDTPARYRLDRERIVSVLVAGSDPERVMRFLRRAAGGQLPQPVEARLRSWMADFGRVTLRRLVVLEVDEPAVLDAMRRDPSLGRWLGHSLNERTVVVSAGRLQDLVVALRRAGYLPRVVDGDGEEGEGP